MAGVTRRRWTGDAPPPTSRWWGRRSLGVSVWDAALDRVRHVYAEFDHVWVSFSGGKDSTAVLNAALAVAREDPARLPLRVVFFDEECIATETAAYCARVAAMPDVAFEWWCLPVRHRNACSTEQAWWWPWAPEARDLWVRPIPEGALTHADLPPRHDWPLEPPEARLSVPETAAWHMTPPTGRTCCLMGIRAAESLVRAKAVVNRRRENWLHPTPNPAAWKGYPIYDWDNEDVWRAPAAMGWDRNRFYDHLEAMGVPRSAQRCAPPFGEEPMRGLWHWAQADPPLWARMCERVPGAATAARYARTDLYSYGTLDKPPGVSWQDYVRRLVEDQPDDVRATTLDKVRGMIARHYRKTDEPIMPTARHPLTGISWQTVATVAARSDTKNRKMVSEAPGRHQAAALRAAYDREAAAVAAGEVDL